MNTQQQFHPAANEGGRPFGQIKDNYGNLASLNDVYDHGSNRAIHWYVF